MKWMPWQIVVLYQECHRFVIWPSAALPLCCILQHGSLYSRCEELLVMKGLIVDTYSFGCRKKATGWLEVKQQP